MLTHRARLIGLVVVLALVACPAAGRDAYDYIDITNPFLQKIPIAIPVFKAMSSTGKEDPASQELSDLLSETLGFTGYFKIQNRGAFLEDPRESGIVASSINFRNWTGIGAELLITGGLLIQDELLELELRLFDAVNERMLLGKRYKGAFKDNRMMIRRFCSEMVHKLTGSGGIFESRIAFVSTTTGTKEIFTCDFDGYNPQQLTRHQSITMMPAWSSDGKWIAYTSYEKGNPNLYIKNLRNKQGTIVAKKGINITPAWVPGRAELAATLSFEDDQEIYLLTQDGKIIKKLTDQSGIDVSPSWSPDGKKMAFVSDRSGSAQIYIQTMDSGEVARLTFEGRYNTQPSWSPRGDKIAYTSRSDGLFNIHIIGADGRGAMQLTSAEGNNESPTWSPDGSLIAYSSTREGPSRIYVMTAFGTDKRRLLSMPGEQTDPQWSPNITTD